MSVKRRQYVPNERVGDHVTVSQLMEQLQEENIELRLKLVKVELYCQQLQAGKIKYKQKYLRARDQLAQIIPNYHPS